MSLARSSAISFVRSSAISSVSESLKDTTGSFEDPTVAGALVISSLLAFVSSACTSTSSLCKRIAVASAAACRSFATSSSAFCLPSLLPFAGSYDGDR